MQIITPDMWPVIAGFMILFLSFVGLTGLLILKSVWEKGKKNKLNFLTTTKLVFGALCLGFVVYNWIGYNSIFSENEELIVGEYHSAKYKLTISDDYTWQITGDNETICRNGKWELVMSEDWCCWNIESDDIRLRTQIGIPKTGSPPKIDFKEQNLIFERKK